MTRERGTLLAAILGSGVVFLDSTVVNVALSKIGQDLPSSFFGVLEGQSYVYNGYLLSLSALLILAGALADAYGRRRMFIAGLVGFGVTSALCGAAPNMETLIALRILQGAAGALLVPGSLALITSTFQGSARGRAFGLWAAASGASTILGPVVGGVLVESVSWRAVFYLNVPLILIALWAAWRYVAESRDPDARRHFDWAGAGLGIVAVGGLSFGAIYGQQHNWDSPIGPVVIAAGAVATVLFLVLMARSDHPLVPLGLFRSRNFAVTNLSTFLIYGALYVSGYEQAIFTQGTLGYTAAAAGFLSVPGSLLLIFLSTRVGSLAARIGPRRFMVVGPLIMAVGLAWLARVPATSVAWRLRVDAPSTYMPTSGFFTDFLPAGILFGLGLAIMVAPLTTALMSSVPEQRAGLGSAINNAISRIGPQLAGALIFVAITAAFYADVASRAPGVDTASAAVRRQVSPLNPPEGNISSALAAAAHTASTDAFHLAMAMAAILLLAGAVVNAVGIRDADVRATASARTADEPSEEAQGEALTAEAIAD